MTKIITCNDRKNSFSRKVDGAKDILEKKERDKPFSHKELIYVEQELEETITGWLAGFKSFCPCHLKSPDFC